MLRRVFYVAGAVKRGIPGKYVLLPFSTAIPLSLNWNKPKSSGDRGPEKNYRRKMKKKQSQSKDVCMDSLLEGLKEVRSGTSKDAKDSVDASVTYES